MVGVNVTKIAQLKPAPSEVPQLLLCAKSPVVAKLMFSKAPVPELVIVTVCCGLVVFTI
jgi:hypothetical protein